VDFIRIRQLGQAIINGIPFGAREIFRMGSLSATSWSTLWAEDDPQQFQSSSSISSIFTRSQNFRRDRVFSCPEALSEHPGKKENFSLSKGSLVSFLFKDFFNGFFILNF
jgi:hypothetical protein